MIASLFTYSYSYYYHYYYSSIVIFIVITRKKNTTGELGYDRLNGTRKIVPSYAKSVVYIWRILDMHRTGTMHIVRHMQKSFVQWSFISKFTCISITIIDKIWYYYYDNYYDHYYLFICLFIFAGGAGDLGVWAQEGHQVGGRHLLLQDSLSQESQERTRQENKTMMKDNI